MNILFAYPTCFNPQRGGVERVTDILAKSLLEKGHNVFYLNWSGEKDNIEYPASIFYLPSSDLEDPKNLRAYNNFLVKNSIDVVINQHGLYEGTYFLSRIKNPEVKLISVLHNDPFGYYDHLFADLMTLRDSSIKEKIKRVARFFLYGKVKGIIHRSLVNHYTFIQEHPQYLCLLSESYKERLKEYCDLPENYVRCIPNPNTYENIKIIPRKEPILLFVGRLYNKAKKIDYLIDIWQQLYKQCPQWKLVIVGDGPDKDTLVNKSLDIPGIEFVGRQDPCPYYEKASIFCMTSIFEGFPMCLTEAMQFGCVPIAFDSFSAVYDIIKPGETGELVKSFDKKEYVGKLIHLIDDETYRKKLSKNAFQYVKRYDIANILPKWIELIEK